MRVTDCGLCTLLIRIAEVGQGQSAKAEAQGLRNSPSLAHHESNRRFAPIEERTSGIDNTLLQRLLITSQMVFILCTGQGLQ